MAEKYSIIWASVICGAHNFLCLLPLWDRALQRWRMSSWYFSATLTMGTMTMLVTAPQLHRQWGHCGTILGYHSKFLVLKTTPKLMVTFVYETECPKITPFWGPPPPPRSKKGHETMSIAIGAAKSKLLLNIAKGTTDPGVECFNKMKNLTNNATYPQAKQPL